MGPMGNLQIENPNTIYMNIETKYVQDYEDVPQTLKREMHKTYKPSIYCQFITTIQLQHFLHSSS